MTPCVPVLCPEVEPHFAHPIRKKHRHLVSRAGALARCGLEIVPHVDLAAELPALARWRPLKRPLAMPPHLRVAAPAALTGSGTVSRRPRMRHEKHREVFDDFGQRTRLKRDIRHKGIPLLNLRCIRSKGRR